MEWIADKKLAWKEAWKEIQVPAWKEIWVPAWKKIWKPVWISEWFPNEDHHHHHKSSGWEDRKDTQSQDTQLVPATLQAIEKQKANQVPQVTQLTGDNQIRWDRSAQVQGQGQLLSITQDLKPPPLPTNSNSEIVNFQDFAKS